MVVRNGTEFRRQSAYNVWNFTKLLYCNHIGRSAECRVLVGGGGDVFGERRSHCIQLPN